MSLKLVSILRAMFFCAPFFCASLAVAQTTIHVGAGQTYTTIQAGINAANSGDTVLVAPGTYNENINFNGKAITVISSGGAASTIIQGDGTMPVVMFDSAEGRDSVLNGFTIQGISNPTLTQFYPGVQIGSAPTILNNIITNNPCNGIDVDFGGPLIQGNVVSNTNASGRPGGCASFTGSGIVLEGYASPGTVVIGNTIVHNQHAVDYDGGGLLIWAAENSVIENNIFADNATSTGEGGGIATFNSDGMIIAQNLFYGNVAQYGGGAIALHPPDATQGPFIGLIQNNTFVGNSSVASTDEYGEPAASQVYVDANLAEYEFTDNIVVGSDSNAALVCGTDYNYLSLTPLVVDHNDIYNSAGPAYGGACPDQTGEYGNISTNPLFKNPAANDYHLLAGSPAIDTGNNSALQLLANLGFALAGDFDGDPRVQDATGKGYPVIDMGAFEYAGDHTINPTTAVLNPSAYDVNAGVSFTLTANMYSPLGTPTGSVTFFEDGSQIGTATIDGTGAASLTLSNGLVPGVHAFLATYSGEGSFTRCESVKIYVLVNVYIAHLNLNSNPNPSVFGQSVVFQTRISSSNGVPSGSIILSDLTTATTLATLTPDATGSASFSISTLTVGDHIVLAQYNGNATYSSATASVDQVVENGFPTTTALTCTPSPIGIGGSAQLTATVTSANGTPTGNVAFTDDGAALGTQGLVNGATSLAYAGAAAGTHTITATYTPTGVFAGGSASCSEVVNAIPTTSTLVVTPTASTYGTPVTLTATVAPTTSPGPSTPTGTVTFLNGASAVGTGTLTGGVASTTISSLAGGNYNLTCTYGGSSIYAGSNCNSVPVVIHAAPTALTVSSSANPTYYGGNLAFTVSLTVSGQAAGEGIPISLSINGQSASLTTNAAGSATYALSTALAPGSYPVMATFAGSSNLAGSNASLTEIITTASTATSLIAAPNPGDVNQPVTLTATVSPQQLITGALNPGGSVSFYDGGTLLGSAALAQNSGNSIGDETALLTVNFSTVGIHSLTAVYGGNADFLGSTSLVFQETIQAGDFSLNVTPGSATAYTGASAALTVDVTSINGFNQTLAFSCTGLPAGAACQFSPGSLTSGQGESALVIQTSAPRKSGSGAGTAAAAAPGALAFLLLAGWRRRRRDWLVRMSIVLLAVGVLLAVIGPLTGCGATDPLGGGTPPGVYQIAVTATTTGSGTPLAHAATVNLKVKSLF